jgi:hypothetical protein
MIKVIMRLIEEENPGSVQELVDLAKARLSKSEEEILRYVTFLQNERRITLRKPSKPDSRTAKAYLKTEQSRWYWIIITLAAATTLIVLTIPENVFPLVYLRYALGVIFVSFLPGYSFIRALFPKLGQSGTNERNIDIVERVALSIGLSLVLVPLVGLILNYTELGVRLAPIILSLFLLTTIFATIAVVREHRNRIKVTV